MYDEPLALRAADQAHYDGCAQCQSRFQSIANAARSSAVLLSVPSFEPQAAPAFASLRRRISQDARRPVPWYQRWLDRNSARMRPLATPAIAIALAVALLTGVAMTGVGGLLKRIFEPTKIVAVQVSPSDAFPRNLLLDYGQVKWLPAAPNPQVVADAATAQKQTGLPVLLPASFPTGVSGPASYAVVPNATASMTFDAARLQASAARNGVHIRPMPASINGSTLVVNVGPSLIEAWGLVATNTQMQMPTLVIAQTRVPTVDSTGATVTQIEDYVLSQPGVPPDVKAQIKLIKDPSTTLPIPIPQGFATTENVQVNGVQGLLIKAVLGAAVVWEKNGVIYAVGGQLTPDQVLAIATSLH